MKNLKRNLVVLGLALATVVLFQNCGAGSPASNSASNSSQINPNYPITQGSPSPLTGSYSPTSVLAGAIVNLSASGGTPPYTYRLISGTGNLTGNLYASSLTAEPVSIDVIDSALKTSRVNFTTSVPATTNSQKFAFTTDFPVCENGSCRRDFNFTVPTFTVLKVRMWGGGGGYASISRGGNTKFLNLLAGEGSYGQEGLASGGDINLPGGKPNGWQRGGDAPGDGGLGAIWYGVFSARQAAAPGGGGCGGGSGGYVEKTYRSGELVPGSVIPVSVGSGAFGQSGIVCGSGGNGEISITWY